MLNNSANAALGIQPGGDIFVARITAVGTSGDLGVPHGWREQRLGSDGDYTDSELGRRGTLVLWPAYGLNDSAASVDDLVFLRLRGWTSSERVFDILGSASASSGAQVAVVIQGFVAGQASGSGCGPNSGAGDHCLPVYHHGIVQEYDSACQEWVNIGCGWMIEVLGRRLETGRRYLASRVGTAPDSLQGVIIDPSSGNCSPSSGAALYVIDVGTPTRSILVGSRIGKLCIGSGAGSGDSQSTSLGDLSDNLIWFHGTAYRWEETSCGYVAIEDLIVADPRGCALTVGDRIAGHFNKMVPNSTINSAQGSGSLADTSCTASYLAVPKDRSNLYSVTCCPGGGVRIYTYADACGRVRITDCCNSGSGGDGFSACGFSSLPNQYSAAVTGVTNGVCLTCTDWNSTKTLTWNGTCWSIIFSPSCIGIACAGWSLCCVGTDMILNICDAQYKLALSSWSPFGSNVMAHVLGTGNAVCNWPASVTVTAV